MLHVSTNNIQLNCQGDKRWGKDYLLNMELF